ncbi:ead/Ea22-like family protein [Citrobacter braakii]
MTALNKQALRESAIHAQSNDDWGYDDDNFHDQATPDVVLALLDELETAESKCREMSSKAMELVCEASLVYSKYNDTQMPDRDLVDMQTLQEMHDLCKGAAQ